MCISTCCRDVWHTSETQQEIVKACRCPQRRHTSPTTPALLSPLQHGRGLTREQLGPPLKALAARHSLALRVQVERLVVVLHVHAGAGEAGVRADLLTAIGCEEELFAGGQGLWGAKAHRHQPVEQVAEAAALAQARERAEGRPRRRCGDTGEEM